MSADFVRMAEEEERRLATELRKNPLFQQLEAVRATLSAYKSNSTPGDTTRTVATISKPKTRAATRTGSKSSTHVAGAVEFLRRIGRRATAREIMEGISSPDIPFDGQKAVNAFASTLSHNALFNNVRGKGYGLQEWGTADRAPKNLSLMGEEIPTPISHPPSDRG
jgi:hypothetical protein